MDEFDRAAKLLFTADALLVCAGAGMGVDSGLPTFRDDHGFWRAYPPFERLGVRFADLATPAHFVSDPTLAWGFYGHRLDLYRSADPHFGFEVLWCWGSALPSGVGVFTSNVDGLFHRAGFDRVGEAHGSIHYLQCVQPCSDDVWPVDDLAVEVDPHSMRAIGSLPSCRNCGGLARPNVLMFGDYGWVGTRSWDTLEALTAWQHSLRDANLVVVEVGAGTTVQTVRHYAEEASRANGALIRINPQDPEIDDRRGVSLRLGVADALNGIDERLATFDQR